MILLLALLIGVVAGLRAMTGPAGVAWGAHLGWFSISGSVLSFMGSIWAAAIFLVLAIVAALIEDVVAVVGAILVSVAAP